MNDRDSIEREILTGIHKMQKDLGIKPERRSVLDYVADGALIALCVFGAALILTPRAKAQELNPGDLSPHPIHCVGAQKHIKNVLSKTGMFKDAFALSGEGARQVSQNIFNHNPPADHILIIRQINGGSIMVPCVWGKNGPQWAGEQSNRVEIDFKFARELAEPNTDLPADEMPKKRAKK